MQTAERDDAFTEHFEASMTPPTWTYRGVSPLISLRADLAGRPTTREDDDAVIVAALLRHAAGQPATKAAKKSLATARRIARRGLTVEQLRQGPGFDEPRP